MATDTESRLAVVAAILADAEVILREIPDIYGGHHKGYAEMCRAMGEHCKADMEALITERLIDEGILGELGILSVADELRGTGE